MAQRDFSISRSSKAIALQTVGLVVMSDILFGIIAFLYVLVRDSLDVDTGFSIFIWLVFLAKMIMTGIIVYGSLKMWLQTRYYVINGNLIIESSGTKHGSQNIYELKYVKSAKYDMTSLGRTLNSGRITLTMSDVEVRQNDTVVLTDVEDPKEIARALKSYKRKNIAK